MSERIEYNGIPMDVERGDDLVTVEVGDYGKGLTGVKLQMSYEYVAETADELIVNDVDSIMDVAAREARKKITEIEDNNE